MKSIRANPTAGAPEGDERIRTAVCVHGAFRTSSAVPSFLGNRLACLADGEGHFAIDKRGRQSRSTGIYNRPVNPVFACGFYVQQRDDDEYFLETFMLQTGLGRIYRIAAKQTPGRRNNPKVRWSVHRAADCLALVGILDEFPLWSKKAEEYVIWREAVIAWNGSRVIEREQWETWRDELIRLRQYSGAVS